MNATDRASFQAADFYSQRAAGMDKLAARERRANRKVYAELYAKRAADFAKRAAQLRDAAWR